MLEQKGDNKKVEVRVTLFGESFVFKGQNEEDIKEAAKHVNGEFLAIKKQFPHLGRHRIVILALMQTSKALLKAKKEKEELLDFFSKGE